jgi:hypothetical protein
MGVQRGPAECSQVQGAIARQVFMAVAPCLIGSSEAMKHPSLARPGTEQLAQIAALCGSRAVESAFAGGVQAVTVR